MEHLLLCLEEKNKHPTPSSPSQIRHRPHHLRPLLRQSPHIKLKLK
ncbi:uncharacterized protein G2W53_011255 [Senna tora]|uniref:Uncharacterized protein n=1 Tax=Senna tora TaxID=362788 RepID=A0A835CAF2_9FABA|nr:uncharacterized protein G2W53_011255 [Senna tora]